MQRTLITAIEREIAQLQEALQEIPEQLKHLQGTRVYMLGRVKPTVIRITTGKNDILVKEVDKADEKPMKSKRKIFVPRAKLRPMILEFARVHPKGFTPTQLKEKVKEVFPKASASFYDTSMYDVLTGMVTAHELGKPSKGLYVSGPQFTPRPKKKKKRVVSAEGEAARMKGYLAYQKRAKAARAANKKKA